MNLSKPQKNNSFSRIVLALLILTLSIDPSVFAYWVWSPESGKFVNPEGAVEDTADQQYDYALSFYEARNYEKAIEELRNLVKKYPGSRVAPEAQYKLATIYEEQNEFYKAFKAYQKIIENYPSSTRSNEVIAREFKIGNVFLSGKKPKLMGVPILPALPKAIEVFDQVAKNAPFGDYGDKALFQLAVAYKRSGNFQKSLETLQNLVENYPESALLPDAKYQLGEVSYQMSKNINRSQEGLDTAEDYFESFLAEYPTANVRKKAKRLKKAIDEKNAEKNFKIAQYYERENYLESAVIYYEDVVRNYPETSWAEQAKEKLMIFHAPVKYIKEKEDVLQSQMAQISLRKNELEAMLEKSGDADAQKAMEIKNSLKTLSQKEKTLKTGMRSFGKQKVTDIRRRRDALDRKQSELKQKVKALAAKKKMMRKNTSEDLRSAFEKWSESLRAEGVALQHERNELEKIEQELGLPSRFRLPFKGKENVEVLRKMHLDTFGELVKEKKLWDLKKEELYEFRKNMLSQLDSLQGEDIEILSQKKEFQELLEQYGGDLRQKTLDLNQEKTEWLALKEKFESKAAELEAKTGKTDWSGLLKAPGKAVKRSWNLVTFSSKDPAARLEEARNKKAELRKRMEDKKGLIQAIQKSFEDELQGRRMIEAESQRPEESLDERLPEEVRLKKKIKLLEREIRWRYEEIQDRNRSKKEKMDQLDALIKEARARGPVAVRAGQAVTAPARGVYGFFRTFLFGLKPREEVIRAKSLAARQGNSAASDYGRIKKLREKVEFESILIETRAREIEKLKKDLRQLKDQAAKRQGFSYRTVFIEKSGSFLEDIVASARKVIPQKERREVLIERLDEETRELARMEAQDLFLDGKIREFEQQAGQKTGTPQPSRKPAGDAAALEKEVASLKQEVELRGARYTENRGRIQKELKEFYRGRLSKRMEERFGITDKSLKQKRKLYIEERKRTEQELIKIVKKEQKLVNKQQELIIEKREKLQDKMTDFKKKEDYRYEVLQNDLEDLFDQSRQIQMEKQNLVEEQKKLSEYLRSEVGSLER